ncbi:isochorismatase family protein [Paraherbaspirillum soli]|uniref:Isochorismatase family protein n=1 Tax=Paraherbaspirillum soli TaxID=631222 RepID=A0ABW0MCP9_9BURK
MKQYKKETLVETALLVVDVQKSLLDEGPWNAEGVLTAIERVSAAARAAEAPIVFVRDLGVVPDGELSPRLTVLAGDVVVEKSYCDSFLGTDLLSQLQFKGVKRLVVAGMQTDYCIDTTCRRAASLGFNVVLVADAHTTVDHEHLQAEQIVAHHNRILRRLSASEGSVTVLKSTEIVFA